MKKIIILLITIVVLTSCGTEFSNQLSSIGKELLVAAGGEILYEYSVKVDGMSEEEAQKAVSDFASICGFNNESVNLGIAWKNGELNSADKTNYITNKVLDLTGAATGEKELMNIIKEGKENQLDYASAVLDYKAGKNNLNIDSLYNEKVKKNAYLMYDTYQNAQTKHAQYVKDKLKIEKELVACGNDPVLAKDVAGYILSVKKSHDYTEQEKRDILRGYGLIKDEKEYELISYISNKNDDEIDMIYETDNQNDESVDAKISDAAACDEKILNIINSKVVSSYNINIVKLSQIQQTELDNIIPLLKEKTELNINITGHTCDIGSEMINEKVGLKRAKEAKNYLVNSGISEERISVSSQGECNPVKPNDSDENRMTNRRITFEVK